MKETYDERRRYMIQRVRELGFGLPVEPSGAFYMLVNAKHLSSNSYRSGLRHPRKSRCRAFLRESISESNAEGFLRFSYANSIENIKEGLDRIEAYLGSL